MEILSEESLNKALKEISKANKPISIKPTKILLPPNIVTYLADLGYDTQEKINELIIALIKDQQ